MYSIKIKDGKKGEKIFDMVMPDELCPICGKNFGGFRWNIMHGEVTSSCCGVCLQIKDYYVNDEHSQEMKDFVKTIGTEDVGYILNIRHDWIEPIKRAFEELGADSINKSVINLAKEYRAEVEK